MGLKDQETLRRRYPAQLATASGTKSAGKSNLSYTATRMATGAGRSCRRASRPLVVVSGSTRDESVYQGSEAPPPPWADVPADILGGVLRFLPCLADRARVRFVCRHWRAAARTQVLPAPLPVLVLPGFMFSCLTSDGRQTGARRAMITVEATGGNVGILGSYDDWLMALRYTGPGMETAGECCLLNAFSSEVVHLPRLRSDSKYRYRCLDVSNGAHLSENYFEAWLSHGALSASPSSGSKYTVAALTYRGCVPGACLYGLALWQPGMTSWYLCLSAEINSFSGDLAFYQGKLYMVWMHTPDIIAFGLRENEHGVSLSCPEHYRINLLIPPDSAIPTRRCNLVVWRGKLLLFIRFFSCRDLHSYNIRNVEVVELDLSTSPCGVTQIHNFGGDCIFVQKSGCRSFSPDLHAGVQGDLIYFYDECIGNRFPYVYNMRDGTVRSFAPGLLGGYLGYPVWIFPSS